MRVARSSCFMLHASAVCAPRALLSSDLPLLIPGLLVRFGLLQQLIDLPLDRVQMALERHGRALASVELLQRLREFL